MMVAPTATPRNGVDPTEGQLKPAGLSLGELIETLPYCPPHGVQGCVECAADATRESLGLCAEHNRKGCNVCERAAAQEERVAHDWQWRDVGTFTEIEPPTPVVSGLLYEGGLTLLHAGIKIGKSTLLWAMIRALSPNGPQFCGMDLPNVQALIFSEEPPHIIGERARQFQIPVACHYANEAAALAMPPDDFAASAYADYHKLGGDFGLIVVDTIGSFLNIQDFNSYSEGGKAMSPLRQLLRQLPSVAMLVLHHDNKGSTTEGFSKALGTTNFGGQADQLIHLRKKDGKRQLSVGGRYSVAPFEYETPMVVDIGPAGVQILGTAADLCATDVGRLLATYSEPATVKAIAGDLGDTHNDKNIRDALASMVADGEVVIAEKGKGNRPTTYLLVSP